MRSLCSMRWFQVLTSSCSSPLLIAQKLISEGATCKLPSLRPQSRDQTSISVSPSPFNVNKQPPSSYARD
ncbi:hypothetical protein QN277_025899 [Acacia crassicarpa]|uniref:Uncharacterized protein n=1 Tax=Acacia crassicarpa TaxID=499986 RepID=A0AAE1K3N1_9FABA|nr:hypothetical protein QN277_025899 [Acacia crassicarpa]